MIEDNNLSSEDIKKAKQEKIDILNKKYQDIKDDLENLK
jgi:hypothetical protein